MFGKQEVIGFKDEMQLVQDYLILEKTRFEERLAVEYSIDENTYDWPVPPLMVQTLVENGIKHGISKLRDGGSISISSKIENDLLKIRILNSGLYDEQLISETAAPIEELNRIHSLGHGSVMNGVLQGIGAILQSAFKTAGALFETVGSAVEGLIDHLSTGGATIVASTGRGVARVINSTGNALEETERGLSDILREIFGGICPLINSVMIALILVYLCYMKKSENERMPRLEYNVTGHEG